MAADASKTGADSQARVSCVPTADEIARVVKYNPETGVLTWAITAPGHRREGKEITGRSSEGRPAVCIFGNKYLVHRVAYLLMTGDWPQGEVDHINGDIADNRWVNLRVSTHAENMRNRGAQSDNKTGLKGAWFCNKYKKFKSVITVNGKKIWLGYFKSAELAHEAYCAAAKKYHGEFANFGQSPSTQSHSSESIALSSAITPSSSTLNGT